MEGEKGKRGQMSHINLYIVYTSNYYGRKSFASRYSPYSILSGFSKKHSEESAELKVWACRIEMSFVISRIAKNCHHVLFFVWSSSRQPRKKKRQPEGPLRKQKQSTPKRSKHRASRSRRVCSVVDKTGRSSCSLEFYVPCT